MSIPFSDRLISVNASNIEESRFAVVQTLALYIYIPYKQFFMGSYFHFLVIILVGEDIFVEEKFVYRRSTKRLTVPGEVLFSVCLACD